jgi:hypothetical protein
MLVAAFALASLLTPSAQPLVPEQPSGHRHRLSSLAPKRKPPRLRAAVEVQSRFGPVGDLYSSRAKRRIASYLRMRLLELRLRGLERASEVIEHRLPLDVLLKEAY